MVRAQVQLTDSQQKRLKELASRRGTSLSQLVREGVEAILAQSEADRRWERLRKAIGVFRDPSGSTDVADDHDRYLNEAREHGLR